MLVRIEGGDMGSRDATPLFFVSVAFKGVSFAASLLFATLTERSTSVTAKGLTGTDCWREGNQQGWKDAGGVRRTSWRARIEVGHGRIMPH
jgi:hypothetical protein